MDDRINHALTDEDRVRIGQIIRARRAELNLTQDDVVELGGPSLGTQRSIENGRAERYQPKTLRSVDDVLRWRPGTAAKLVSGNLVALESAEAPPGDLGMLLRDARLAAGRSIRAAARVANLSEARWRQLEAGYELRDGHQLPARPKPATVVQAADAVGVDADAALKAAGLDDVDPAAVRASGRTEAVDDRIVAPPLTDENFWTMFGWRVSTARDDAGISQVGLARALADQGLPYHQATIYKIETGQRKVPANELVPLAQALGVTVDMLLGRGPDDDRAAAATIDRLVYLVRSANVAELQRLRDVVDTALAIRLEGE